MASLAGARAGLTSAFGTLQTAGANLGLGGLAVGGGLLAVKNAPRPVPGTVRIGLLLADANLIGNDFAYQNAIWGLQSAGQNENARNVAAVAAWNALGMARVNLLNALANLKNCQGEHGK